MPSRFRWFPNCLGMLLLLICWLSGCGGSREALLQQAQSALDRSDLDTARKIYLKLLSQQPEDPDTIQGMVSLSRLSGAADEVLYWSRELLRYRPWDRRANIEVGKKLLQEGNLKDAAVRFILAYKDSVFKQDKSEALEWLALVKQAETARNPAKGSS